MTRQNWKPYVRGATINTIAMKCKIISKPVPGLDWRKWDRSDIEIWTELIRKSGEPLTGRELKELHRIKTKYKLEKYYSFTSNNRQHGGV